MHIGEGTLLLVITQGSRLIEAQRFREGHRANHILALKAFAQKRPTSLLATDSPTATCDFKEEKEQQSHQGSQKQMQKS